MIRAGGVIGAALARAHAPSRSSYPAPPATQVEQEPDDALGTANLLTFTAPPAGYQQVSKAKVFGAVTSGTDADFYRLDVPCGSKLGLAVGYGSVSNGMPSFDGAMKARLLSSGGSVLADETADGEISYTPPAFVICPPFQTTTYYVRIARPAGATYYFLYVDHYK